MLKECVDVQQQEDCPQFSRILSKYDGRLYCTLPSEAVDLNFTNYTLCWAFDFGGYEKLLSKYIYVAVKVQINRF